MLVNRESLDLAFKGFKTVYSDAYLAAPSHFDKIAMTVPSSSRDETYGWLGQFPAMREWLAERIIHNLAAHSFTITNRRLKSTVAVQRTDIEDDRLGIFKPAFSEMSNNARRHPDELVLGLLKAGSRTNCYDGQNYFDTDHPVIGSDGAVKSVANTDGGSGAPWFLLDVSRGVRPIIRAGSAQNTSSSRSPTATTIMCS